MFAQIRSYTESLSVGGWTAIYDALEAAYNLITRQAAADPDRITTVVLLTDGANNRGDDLTGFAAFYHRLPPATASAPVFPILFGEARRSEKNAIATLTGWQQPTNRTQKDHSAPMLK